MILFSSFGVNNFVKNKGVEKEEYIITPHREDGSSAGRRSGEQDYGTWLLNRIPEAERGHRPQSYSGRNFLEVGDPVAVYVTEPEVMLWGGMKCGTTVFSMSHHKYRN